MKRAIWWIRRLGNNITMLIVMFLLIGCQKTIDLDILDSPTKIKVYSIFEYATSVEISLRTTSSMNTDYLEKPITDAEIFLYRNNKILDTIINSLTGNYQFNSLEYNPGEILSCEIVINDQHITSQTTIPFPMEKVEISVDTIPTIRPDGEYAINITVSFQDKSESENFYDIELWTKTLIASTKNDYLLSRIKSDDPVITRQAYSNPLAFITGADAMSLPFTDESFDGERKEITFYYCPAFSETTLGDVTTSYILPHDLVIVFRNTNESYYNYKVSLIRHLLARESDEIFGASTPVPVISNINGGIGIFSCVNSMVDSMTIHKINITK